MPVRKRLIASGEIALWKDGPQDRIVPLRKPDLSLLKAAEIRIIDDIIDQFRNATAAAVSKISHLFLGWKAAFAEGEKTLIPYDTDLVSNRPLDPFDSLFARDRAADLGYA